MKLKKYDFNKNDEIEILNTKNASKNVFRLKHIKQLTR